MASRNLNIYTVMLITASLFLLFANILLAIEWSRMSL